VVLKWTGTLPKKKNSGQEKSTTFLKVYEEMNKVRSLDTVIGSGSGSRLAELGGGETEIGQFIHLDPASGCESCPERWESRSLS